MSINLFPVSRSCKNTLGGVKKAYMANFELHPRSLISVDGMELLSIPETNFYEIDGDGSYTQNQAVQNGAFYFNQSISLKLPRVYGNYDISKFYGNEFRLVVLTENNQYLLFGLYNGLNFTTSNTTGINKEEFNGFDVTFEGLEESQAYLVNNLVTTGIIIITPDEETALNYTLNTDI